MNCTFLFLNGIATPQVTTRSEYVCCIANLELERGLACQCMGARAHTKLNPVGLCRANRARRMPARPSPPPFLIYTSTSASNVPSEYRVPSLMYQTAAGFLG